MFLLSIFNELALLEIVVALDIRMHQTYHKKVYIYQILRSRGANFC